MKRFFVSFCRIAVPLLLIMSCSSCTGDSAEECGKFMKRGDIYFERQAFRKAILEYKKAIQAEQEFSEAHHRLAIAYLKTAQTKQALAELERTIELDSQNLDAQLKIGQFHLAAKRTKEAGNKADFVLKQDPENMEALFLKMGAFLQTGDVTSVTKILKHIVMLDKKQTRAWIFLARIAESQKRFVKAQSYLSQALEINPEKPAINLELARFYEQRMAFSKAEKEFQQAVAKSTEHVAVMAQLGDFYLRRGNTEQAEKIYLKIVEMTPGSIGPKMTVGVFYASQQNWDQATHWMNKALTLQPDNLDIQNALASIYYAKGQEEEALQLVEQILKVDETNLQACMLKADVYFRKGAYEKAKASYLTVTKIRPDNLIAYFQLAKLHRRDLNYDKALSCLDKVLSLKADYKPALATKVSIFVDQRQPDKALVFLDEQILKHEKDTMMSAALYQMQAEVLALQRDYEKSEFALKKALALNPNLVGIYLSLAKVYNARGKTREAIVQLQKLIEKKSDFVRAYLDLGAIYEAEGKMEEAKKTYERALGIDPDSGPVANNLAWLLLLENQDIDRALDLATQAKAQLPDDPRIMDTLAMALIAKGDYPGAVIELRQAVEKTPENPTTLYHLGLAYWKDGAGDKAEDALDNALKLKKQFPERQAAQALLAEIKDQGR